MGTRNLTMVQFNNEIKVAQYGQWDGYPSGQGATILEFCSNGVNLEKLKLKLEKVRFFREGEPLEFNKKLEEKDAYTHWLYDNYNHRDIGGKILERIVESEEDEEEIILENEYDFGYDGLFCEWAYCVNLDTNKLEVYKGFGKRPLGKKQRFYKENQKPDEYGYYAIRMVKQFDLNNLPSEAEFVEQLER